MARWFATDILKRGKKPVPSTKPQPRKSSLSRVGFSEEALEGLKDLDARTPPPDVSTQSGYAPSYQWNERLSTKASAGGGLVTNENGHKVPHYHGHRERLRTRFLAGGHQPMPEYEILELLLFNAISRIDVKPLAKRLLSAFGDLNGVIAASEHRLLQIEGATPKVYYHLRLAEAFAQRMRQGSRRLVSPTERPPCI